MLRSVNNLEGFALGAKDGAIGRVRSFLFDCRAWAVRYLVVDTGRWLRGRQVLIPPSVLDVPDWPDRVFRVAEAQGEQGTGVLVEAPEESSLRSTREVRGYRIHATDGQFGPVEDFIVSDEDWVIRYLVVDTRNWLLGQRVLIAPEWVKDIDWEQREVRADVPKETIEDSPPYDPSAPINRAYEVRMYDYCGRPKYWA